MIVVLTGFGAFAGVADNPSAHIAQYAQLPNHINTIRRVLEVTPTACDDFLAEIIPYKPDVALFFGVASDRDKICLETTAYNALKPAFQGEFKARPIKAKSAEKICTAISGMSELAEKICEYGLEATVSDDPGRYICNYLYYKALQQACPQTKVLFVHVPLPTKPGSLEKLITLPQLILESMSKPRWRCKSR